MIHWWEKDDSESRQHPLGDLVPEAGPCPSCGSRIVYSGNYFCEYYDWSPEPSCTWALSHPATEDEDREICDRLGIDYL
jgi:hypothetical protein